MDSIEELVRNIDPTKSVLFFGSGASVSSGGPTGRELAGRLNARLAPGDPVSGELVEVASILERRVGRAAVVEVVRDSLTALKPDGALVALAGYPWASIYTTNFDQLLEQAFANAGRLLNVVRSNHDWELGHTPGVPTLYKLHGCVTQDRASGDATSMILTLDDFDESLSFRDLLFDRLKIELAGGTVVVIGHSLADPDIQEELKKAVQLQRRAAAPGKVRLLMYEFDEERAALWRSRGAHSVTGGTLNEFAQALVTGPAAVAPAVAAPGDVPGLPATLLACTISVSETTEGPRPQSLFGGSPASYGDITAGFTFERDIEDALLRESRPVLIVLGAAGTGKTTLARRVVSALARTPGAGAFEHRREFPLVFKDWLKFERHLREQGKTAVLFIDNCSVFQREVNQLVRGLPENPALRVILTAETSAWSVRQKDARLFSDSRIHYLRELSRNEITRLLAVVGHGPLRSLIGADFLAKPRAEQERTLVGRCKSDMFVCLKALFSVDSLDDIILREYAQIDELHRNVYRLTCALEAAGAIVHRQMVLRLAGLSAHQIAESLAVLDGLVFESEQNSSLGIYVWRTRHEVISTIISKYKYNEPQELYELLKSAIQTSNPSFYEEVRTLREMCSSERGIRALPDPEQRLELFRLIAAAIPSDRVSRHRLVSELIYLERVGEADAELQRAVRDVRLDGPLQRYKIKLLIMRSRDQRLLVEDRRAILNLAFSEIETGIQGFKDNKYMYLAAADAAQEWHQLTEEVGRIEWAKHLLRGAEEQLLDPDLGHRFQELARM